MIRVGGKRAEKRRKDYDSNGIIKKYEKYFLSHILLLDWIGP